LTSCINRCMKRKKVRYAIPCSFGKGRPTKDSFFFVTFDTKNEDEAMRLAECVCGDTADKALVIITEDGEIIELN
jgi:hypothetical protein